ncbi:MAG TPA: carotenoid oxygenase family protein [Acidimicrobiales bacterium]|nr:carotenoid oxygenase family protein [Acidimicrobiales bacterium]
MRGAMTRRQFMARAGITAVAAPGFASLLAACGGSSDSSAAPTSSAPVTEAYDPDTPWWLQGNFAPVTQELEAFDLTVAGELPAALTGLYARNGSNARQADNGHWFLGDGMLHGVRLDEGQAAWYRNRWVRTGLYESGAGFTDGPPGGETTYSNVSAFTHAGRLLTSGEIGYPYELSVDDLSTVGAHDFAGRLTTSMTAHPKIDPDTGFMHFFGYGFAEPFLTYHVADERGRLVSSQPVDVAGPTMIHDFAITDQDVVFWEFPVVFDIDLALAGEGMPFRWDASYGARIGVLPLGGPTTAARWVEVDPAYVFHGINAYRSGDDVIVDVSQFATMFDGGVLGQEGAIHRWTIGTGDAALTYRDDVLQSELPMELPTRDPRRVGREHRYGWLVESPVDPDTVRFGGLYRLEVSTGETQYWDAGPGRSANEGLFVPRPGGTDEDDGWVLTYVYDAATEGSELVVLDASAIDGGPLATVELPGRVPHGFHAAWVPAH